MSARRGDQERDERSREEPRRRDAAAAKPRADRGLHPSGASGGRRGPPRRDKTWIGVDVGTVRVGVARSDPRGVLATPLVTLTRDPAGNRDIAELAELVREHEAIGVVVGLPRTLADREGASAQMARDYAAALANAISPIPVQHVDERLTTLSAQRKLALGTIRGRAKRAVIDQVAAVELLQHWLDTLGSQQ